MTKRQQMKRERSKLNRGGIKAIDEKKDDNKIKGKGNKKIDNFTVVYDYLNIIEWIFLKSNICMKNNIDSCLAKLSLSSRQNRIGKK